MFGAWAVFLEIEGQGSVRIALERLVIAPK